MKTVLVLNAGTPEGNTARVLEAMTQLLEKNSNLCVRSVTLANSQGQLSMASGECQKALEAADAILIGTGTYWDSWSASLTQWLEAVTDLEATSAILGKPAAVVVTAHEVGAKGVLSRLQGVLCSMGFLIPPMSALVHTHLHQMAEDRPDADPSEFWDRTDWEILAHNLTEAVLGTNRWRAWSVSTDYRKVWVK